MRNILLSVLFIFLFSGSFAGERNKKNNSISPQEPLDLFLCIGQSNMAGRGRLSPEVMDTLNHIYLFNGEDKFEKAVNPLNRYSTIRKDISMQGVGPSYGFAKEIAAHTGHTVGLIVNARGNTSIESWQKGHEKGYYAEAVRKAKKAMKYGKLKAILWHQGEANASNPEKCKQLLIKLASDLRKDLKSPDLLIVVGEISQWNWTKKEAGTQPFNQMIQTIPTFIPHSAWVSSEGLMPLKDETDPHFDTPSQLLLGKRYAEKVLEHCY